MSDEINFTPDEQPTAAPAQPTPASDGISFQPDDQQAALEDKYGSPIEQAKAFAEGAASAATFGLSTGVERAFGVNPQSIQERAKTGAHTVGQIAGLIGTSFIPGAAEAEALNPISAASILEHAGQAASGDIQNVFAKNALKYGVENSLFAAGDEFSKYLASDDPNVSSTAVQNAAAHVGLAGLIGAGFGVAGAGLGKVSNLWGASKAVDTAGELSKIDSGAEPSLTPEVQQQVLKEAGNLKPNANEIINAGATIGAPVPEGMTSASDFVQSIDSSLTKQPTIFGIQRQQLYQQGFDAANKAVTDTMQTDLPDGISKAQIGDQVFSSLNDKIEQVKGPIDELYNAIKTDTNTVPVNPKAIKQVVGNLLRQDIVKVTESSPAASFIKKIANDLTNVQNVDQLRAVSNSLNQYVGENPTLAHFASDIRERISNLQTNSIKGFAKEMLVPGNAANASIRDLLSKIDSASEMYGPFKEDLKTLANGLGMGKIGGPEDFLQKLDRTKPEKIVDRVFANKDARFLKFFSERFPDEMKAVTDFQKQEILNEASKTGTLSAKNVFNKLDKLSPELQEVMFSPEDIQKLNASRTWINNIPKDINPSNTSKGLAYNEFFKSPIAAGLMHVGDAGKLAMLKFLSSGAPISATGFKAATDYFSSAIEGADMASKAAGSIFNSSIDTIPKRYIPSKEEINLLDSKVKEFQTKPDGLSSVGGETGHYLPNHVVAIAQTAGGAVTYLNSQRPEPLKPSPLDKEIPVSTAKKQAYENTLSIAQQPLVVIQKLKDGTLTSKDMKDLNVMYPQLYQTLKQNVIKSMTNHLSDGGKVPQKIRTTLSLFMGEPLMPSLQPQSIQAIQSVYTNQAPVPSPQNGPVKKGSTKDLGKLSQIAETPSQARQSAARE
jgi:hypothetical protein